STLANNTEPFGVYRFVRNFKEKFEPAVRSVIPVDKEIEEKYNETLDPSSTHPTAKAIKDAENGLTRNRCFISRTSVLNIVGYEQPYISGSSLKGACHTALLDAHADHTNGDYTDKDDLDEKIFKISKCNFEKSPMRLLKFSDLLPNKDAYSRVIKAEREKKEENGENNTSDNGKIPSFVEVIDYAQYRAFEGTLNIITPEYSLIDKSLAINNPNALSKQIQEFYNNKIYNELEGHDYWFLPYQDLEKALEPSFQNGTAFIVRLGKYQGIESITLDLADIKNATTCTYAKENARGGGTIDIPFGLALVEIDPEGENKALKTFCDACHSTMPDFQLAQLRQKILNNIQKK
ncbi:MAG: RAMP superfamily CRISPR-associated protein, partial [Succinatimonas hippei]|nr:RAMP superfamily CRISPR-associated protein [Succinatimonas hippei]